MKLPDRFPELTSFNSSNVQVINDAHHEEFRDLTGKDTIILCESSHAMTDEMLESFLQKNQNKFVIFVGSRKISPVYEQKYHCKLFYIDSADIWYNKLLPQLPVNFDDRKIQKHFISLNNRGQWDRHALFQIVCNYKLFDQCYFSYQMKDRFNKGKPKQYAELNKIVGLTYWNQDLDLDQLYEKIPFINGVDPKGLLVAESNPYNIIDFDLYQKSLFAMVSETYIESWLDPFCSEKTFKPLAIGMPMLIFSAPRLLEKLRRQGFQTFDTIFDESYDLIDNPQVRFELIAKQLLEICKFDHYQLMDLYDQIKPVCEHNYNWFWHDWQKVYDKEMSELTDKIADLIK